MSKNTQTRAKNMIWGALVADAAAMGLHWIYDQPHIRKIAPSDPEFCEPLKANYEGVPGFFAHENKTSGEQSQYGEQVLVMLQSLAATNGQYDVNHYAQSFRNHFGYGGNYVGYIDHATRETLNNFTRAEDDAKACAKSIPFNGDPAVTTFVTAKALATTSQYGKNIVGKKFEEAVRVKHDDDSIVEYALRVLENIQSMEISRGARDEQFPATAKLPPLVAITKANGSLNDTSFAPTIESAIKVTNTHSNALTYGYTCARLMEASVDGASVDDIVQAGLGHSGDEVSNSI